MLMMAALGNKPTDPVQQRSGVQNVAIRGSQPMNVAQSLEETQRQTRDVPLVRAEMTVFVAERFEDFEPRNALVA